MYHKFNRLQFLLLAAFTLLSAPAYAQQKRANVYLEFCSRWTNDRLPKVGDQIFNDIWGYAAPDGREYAIIGSTDSTYFVEVTDPYHPVVRDAEAGKFNAAVHRDFKTYSHYAYGVCDEGFSSLQIFDLQYLPDSVHKVYDSDSLVVKSHNIQIEGNRLYVCAHKYWNVDRTPGSCPMSVFSLEDPVRPKLLAHIQPQSAGTTLMFDYVHDVYVKHDTAFMSTGDPGLFIYDLRNPSQPVFIQSITPPYPGNGYNHSGWLSDDGNYYVFADETHGSPLKLTDVSTIHGHRNPELPIVSVFGSHSDEGSIPHNPFIKGNYIYVSYYHEGVVVFDMSNPANVVKAAQYDTYPQNNNKSNNKYGGYEGCWGVYPFLPSGTIVASDMQNGLFVLKLDTFPVFSDTVSIKLLSNPFRQNIQVQIGLNQAKPFSMRLMDMQGKIIESNNFAGQHGTSVYEWQPSAEIRNGVYILEVKAADFQKILKIVKT